MANLVKTRGRPRKYKSIPPSIFKLAFEGIHVDVLSKVIAESIGEPKSNFTHELAHVILAYLPLAALRSTARMLKGATKRPDIHIVILLRDIAIVYAKLVNSCPKKELQKINGYRETRRSYYGLKNEAPVELFARAMLKAVKVNHTQTFRRPAREAIKYL